MTGLVPDALPRPLLPNAIPLVMGGEVVGKSGVREFGLCFVGVKQRVGVEHFEGGSWTGNFVWHRLWRGVRGVVLQ